MPAAQGPIHVKRQSKRKQTRKPPAAIFGPIGRADAGITRAQRVAGQRTQRARRRVERRVVVPYVPKLAHPTPAQRGAAQSIVARGLQRQGIRTAAEVQALPAAQRQRVNRAKGYSRTNVKRSDAAAAAAHGLSAPTLQLLAQLGRQLRAQRGDRVQAGHHTKVGAPFGLATIDLTNLGHTLAGATTLGKGDLGPRELFRHSASDIGALGTSPFIGGYELGAGAVDVARHGDTSRLRKLAKGVGEGLTHSVPGELLQGHPGKAAESFRQHPVFAALDVAGAAGAAGRVAGGVARAAGSRVGAAGARGALARFGSTVRPAIGLNEDGGLAVTQRSFSKDSGRKGVQVLQDRAREPLLDARGNVVTVMDRGRRVPVLRAHPGERGQLHKRRMDFTASRANASERLAREVAGHNVGRATAGGRVKGRLSRSAQQVVSMAVEGTIRPAHFAADVDKRIARLEAKLADPKASYRHTGEVKQARAEVAALRKARELSPEQQARVFAARDRIVATRRAQDAQEVRLGTLDQRQAERAALEPYAISHMDARHVTVEEHAALERDARKAEGHARAKVDGLPKGPERAHALAEWRRARDHRIEVSGRHPGEVRQHENAQTQAKRATAAHDRAKAKLDKLERAKQRLTGRRQVQGGENAMRRLRAGEGGGSRSQRVLRYIDAALKDPGLEKGAAKEGQRARVLAKVDRELERARVQEKAARKAARQARKAAAGAKLPDAAAALRTAEGKHLPNEAIHAHMAEHGLEPDQVAHLSHKPLGNAAYHKRFDVSTRPGQPTQRRTGHAFERGTSGFGAEQVQDTAAHAATRAVKAQQIDQFVHDNALKHPAVAKAARGEALSKAEQRVVDRGGGFTPKEGVELADRLKHDTGREYVAVRTFGARVSAKTQAEIRGMQSPRAFEGLSGKLLNDRIVNPDDLAHLRDKGARNVALVPLEDMNRLARHMASAGEIEAALQMLNRPFRFSVLAQPRWLTGNFIEPYLIRLPSVGSGLVNLPGLAVDIAASRKIIRGMERSGDPKVRAAAESIKAQQHGGLFLGGRGASNRRRARDSSSKAMQTAAVVRDLPVVKQLGDLAAFVPSQYFRANRQLIERWAQEAGFGHQARADLREITGSWTKTVTLGRKAIEEVQAGLVDTATQERFMRAQHELLGKYEGFGPRMRRLIQTVAPFLPWAMSAARFVFWTMPAHHTVLTSLLLKTEAVVDASWQESHKPGVVPPGTLRLAIPTKKGGFTDIARYGPYGFTAPIVQGDLQGVTDQFMPQVSGAVAAVQGKDPFGRDLRVQPTKGNPGGVPSGWDKVLIALNSLGEATLGPYPALARRISEHGETAYGNSFLWAPKTKPGTSHGMSGVRRALDPFRPTYLRSGSGGSSAASRAPADEAQAILAGSRGHVTRSPEVSEAQRILAGSRR